MSDIVRYKSKAEWLSRDPVLRSGEPGMEDDTGKVKIGDGTKKWSQLAYSDNQPYMLPLATVTTVTVKSASTPQTATAPAPAASSTSLKDVRPGPWEDLVRAAQFGYSHTASILGDSTSDNLSAFEWPLLVLKILGTKYPAIRMEHYQFDDATQAYGAVNVVNAGAAATGGVIVHDTFSVDGSAVGAAADTKGAWVGSGTVAKSGGKAAFSGTGSAVSAITPMQDSTVTTKMQVTTAGSSGFNAFRFGNGISNAALNGYGVYVTLSLNGTWVTHLTLGKTTASGGIQTVSNETLDLGLGNVTAKNVTIETSLIGLTFTVKITVEGRATITRTFNITAQEKSEIGSFAGVAQNPGNGVAGIVFDEVKLETAIIPTPVIKIYNGSVAGKNPDYVRAAGRLAKLMPIPIDSALLSFGHNGHLAVGGVPEFAAGYKQTIDLIKAAQTNAKIYIGSQNPEFTPRDASLILTHAARQAKLLDVARDNDCRYIPVFEAFRNANADNGKSLVQADGVHQTNPTTLAPTDGFGSTLWAKTVVGSLV